MTFDGKQYKERAGLLIANGIVYTSWASHCDINPYTGWLIGYDQSTLQRVTVMNLTPNGNEASIWAAGAGPAADASGTLFLLTANGTFDTTLDERVSFTGGLRQRVREAHAIGDVAPGYGLFHDVEHRVRVCG